jgi:hypothetical protein
MKWSYQWRISGESAACQLHIRSFWVFILKINKSDTPLTRCFFVYPCFRACVGLDFVADYISYFSLTWSCILFIFVFRSAVSVQLQWQHPKEFRFENNLIKIASCRVGLYYSTIYGHGFVLRHGHDRWRCCVVELPSLK